MIHKVTIRFVTAGKYGIAGEGDLHSEVYFRDVPPSRVKALLDLAMQGVLDRAYDRPDREFTEEDEKFLRDCGIGNA